MELDWCSDIEGGSNWGRAWLHPGNGKTYTITKMASVTLKKPGPQALAPSLGPIPNGSLSLGKLRVMRQDDRGCIVDGTQFYARIQDDGEEGGAPDDGALWQYIRYMVMEVTKTDGLQPPYIGHLATPEAQRWADGIGLMLRWDHFHAAIASYCVANLPMLLSCAEEIRAVDQLRPARAAFLPDMILQDYRRFRNEQRYMQALISLVPDICSWHGSNREGCSALPTNNIYGQRPLCALHYARVQMRIADVMHFMPAALVQLVGIYY